MKLVMNKLTYNKMKMLVDMVDTETCGLALSYRNGDDIIVSNFILAEYMGNEMNGLHDHSDMSSSARTTIAKDALVRHQLTAKEIKLQCNVWFHSHAYFGVFWSGQDERCIRCFPERDLVSIVMNKQGKILARYDSAFLDRVETSHIKEIEIQNVSFNMDRQLEKFKLEIEERNRKYKEHPKEMYQFRKDSPCILDNQIFSTKKSSETTQSKLWELGELDLFSC